MAVSVLEVHHILIRISRIRDIREMEMKEEQRSSNVCLCHWAKYLFELEELLTRDQQVASSFRFLVAPCFRCFAEVSEYW